MKKIKVLRIITRMNVGGPAIQATLLTSGLNGDQFHSILVTGQIGSNEGDMGYLATEHGIEPLIVSELQREPHITRDIISFIKLYRFIKKERPDIVHTHTAKAGTVGRLAARLAGVPLVIHTFHGHVFHSYFNPLKTRIFLLMERLLFGITNKIVVISEKQKDEMMKYLRLNSDEKLALIPLGFDLDRFLINDMKDKRDKLRKELNIPHEAIAIGIIGRLTAVKNHKMFLGAITEIKKRSSDRIIKFLIVGDGELKDELVALSHKLCLTEDAIFTGWRKDMDSVYSALDIVTLTSHNEGTPVTLIEALANAKAVVATDVGGVRDVVENGKSGFIVPSGDVSAFSEAVSLLVNDAEKRQRFGLYGRDFVKNNFTKEKLINAIENLYTAEHQIHPQLNQSRRCK